MSLIPPSPSSAPALGAPNETGRLSTILNDLLAHARERCSPRGQDPRTPDAPVPTNPQSPAPATQAAPTASNTPPAPVTPDASARITFGMLLSALGERGHAVLILLMAFPFLVPTPPGFSTPAGLAIGFLGLSIALYRKPWLPGFVANRTLSLQTLERIINVTLKLFSKIERWVRPRLGIFLSPALHWLTGLSLVSAAFVLALPIPIPWNNGPPAIVILLLGLGLLERDGLLLLLGHIGNLLLWVALFLAGDFLWKLAESIWTKIF